MYVIFIYYLFLYYIKYSPYKSVPSKSCRHQSHLNFFMYLQIFAAAIIHFREINKLELKSSTELYLVGKNQN